jgi:hypothetical protein
MNELSKNIRCVLLRSGIKIWIEQEKEATLKNMIEQGVKFIEYEGQYINTADITGIFTPDKMADLTREKNGEWYCRFSRWHSRGVKCLCAQDVEFDRQAAATDELLKARPQPTSFINPEGKIENYGFPRL